MKGFLLFAALFLVFPGAFSYYNHLSVTVGARDLSIRCDLSLSNDSVRIALPKRAHLTGVNSPGTPNVNYNNSQNTVLVANVQSVCQGKLRLDYTLPVSGSEFSVSDWMPVPDENGVYSATITSPAGQTGMFLPYRDRISDGYRVDPSDQPILFSGRFTDEEDSFHGRKFEWVRLTRPETTLSNAASVLSGFEKWLFPLAVKQVILIELPMIRDTVRICGGRLFLVVNSSRKEEIRRAFASLYFRAVLGWKEDYVFAFTDLYRRLIGGEGDLEKDDAEWVPLPRDDYYRNVLKNGFTRTEMGRAGVADMLENFSLLHFCYYTVGRESFLSGIKNYLASSRTQPESIEMIFTNSGDAREAVRFCSAHLLPKAKFVPDLILKENTVYRSTDQLPDISVRIGGEIREIVWEGKRTYNLNNVNGDIAVDPFHLVPQLDFYNDRSAADPIVKAETALVYRTVLQHRHFGGETVRALLDLKTFKMPEGNVFGLAKDAPAYVSIVKFTAPVNGKLMEGLKELVMTVDTNARVKVLAERIRF